MKIVDTILKIKTDKLPPEVDFIENKIKENSIEPLRWAIVDVKKDELILSVAGIIL